MPSYVSILARVYTSEAYLPLEGVPVIFSQLQDDGTKQLLSIRITDSSGLTDPLQIETPDVSLSLIPEYTLRPYAVLEISAGTPGYNQITVEGVQIFPGIETIQGIQLRPVSADERDQTILFPEYTQKL